MQSQAPHPTPPLQHKQHPSTPAPSSLRAAPFQPFSTNTQRKLCHFTETSACLRLQPEVALTCLEVRPNGSLSCALQLLPFVAQSVLLLGKLGLRGNRHKRRLQRVRALRNCKNHRPQRTHKPKHKWSALSHHTNTYKSSGCSSCRAS